MKEAAMFYNQMDPAIVKRIVLARLYAEGFTEDTIYRQQLFHKLAGFPQNKRGPDEGSFYG